MEMPKCNKIDFDSRFEASEYVAFMRKNPGKHKSKNPAKLRPYCCARCERWHLTTIKKAMRRRMERSGTSRD